VEETPGRLEYEVALYRETSPNTMAARSSSNAGAVITGMDSHELPVDQAVPIGTRLQLRAKINHESGILNTFLLFTLSSCPSSASQTHDKNLYRNHNRNTFKMNKQHGSMPN
jgi:hypothetical protein